MNNNTIIEFGFRIIIMKNYGDLGGCYPPQSPRPTASASISKILHKILSLFH